MKAPAFQLYPQDFISSLDVQLMSAAEVGAYCLLLFNSWTQPRQGFLPNDEAQLRHLSRLSPEEWKTSKKKLLAKFPATDDKKHRYNPRLLVEAEKQAAFREKQAEHGKLGGRPKRDEKPDKAKPFLGESQKNPSLSQPLGKPNPARAHSSSSPSFSSSFSSSEETSSLRSEDAATAADSGQEKKIGSANLQPESPPADASHTRGAADVPTRKPARPKQPKAPPGSIDPAAYDLPEWAGIEFSQDLAEWLQRRQTRPDAKPLQAQAIQEYLTELAGYTPDFCQAIFRKSRQNPQWKGLTFDDTPAAFARQAQPNPRHAARSNHPLPGAKPTENAAFGARALSAQLRAIREQRDAEVGGVVHLSPATGPYPCQGAAVAPGFGAPQG